MKILEMTTFLRGGAGVFIVEVSKELKKAGHTVHVVSSGKSGDFVDWDKLYGDLHENDIKYSNIDFFNRSSEVFWNEAYKLADLLEKENFDLIHVHSGTPALGAHVAKGIIEKNIPVIATFHSWGKDRPEWMNKADIWAFNQCEEVYFDSYEYENYAVNEGITTSKGVIELGVLLNPQSYMDRKEELRKQLCINYNFEKDDIIITQLGEITERKGQLDLIKTVGELYKDNELGGRRLKLLIIGECKNPQYEKRLNDTIEEYGIKNEVTFAGWIPNPHELLAASDLFVFPTYSEGFGLVIIEAMALKIPTIFSTVEGTMDIIKAIGKDSFGTFIPGDTINIERQIIDFLNLDDESKRNLSDRISQSILQRYSSEITAEKYRKVIEKYK